MYKSEVYSKHNQSFYAKIVADSIANNIRITTMELSYPRLIHQEYLTHRMFSRNASSSRAIPVAKMIEQVETNPAMPIHWGKNQSGMQAYEEVENWSNDWWKIAAKKSAETANQAIAYGYHKQIVNRLLEPFQWIKVVCTATEWDNFFTIRDHHAAQPEIQELAKLMKEAMDKSTPNELKSGEWYLPYVNHNSQDMIDEQHSMNWDDYIKVAIKASVARCARVSYMKHDNSNPSIEEDIELYNMLAVRPYKSDKITLDVDEPVHLSPLEHQATPMPYVNHKQWARQAKPNQELWEKGITHMDKSLNLWSANFRGWIQYRQLHGDI